VRECCGQPNSVATGVDYVTRQLTILPEISRTRGTGKIFGTQEIRVPLTSLIIIIIIIIIITIPLRYIRMLRTRRTYTFCFSYCVSHCYRCESTVTISNSWKFGLKMAAYYGSFRAYTIIQWRPHDRSSSRFDTIPACDGQSDGWTDGIYHTALCI